jgi:hypothetical protein
VFARGHDAPGDFVPQDERERMARGDSAVREPDVGVADTAARHFDDDLVSRGNQRRELVQAQWLSGCE